MWEGSSTQSTNSSKFFSWQLRISSDAPEFLLRDLFESVTIFLWDSPWEDGFDRNIKPRPALSYLEAEQAVEILRAEFSIWIWKDEISLVSSGSNPFLTCEASLVYYSYCPFECFWIATDAYQLCFALRSACQMHSQTLVHTLTCQRRARYGNLTSSGHQ